jgi:hypothetical protein
VGWYCAGRLRLTERGAELSDERGNGARELAAQVLVSP